MRILVACEESQRVCIEFRKQNQEAYSCDILSCSGEHPEWHIQNDVLNHLNDGWDMMIAHPPCTHLSVSGARHFKQKREDGRQQQSIDFFMKFINAPIKRICVENPVSIISTIYRKPDQIIQPYMFGDNAMKTTCLWLKNLPKLKPTNIIKPDIKTLKNGKKFSLWEYKISMNHKSRSNLRSKTFLGIAKAMAEQWSNLKNIQTSFNEWI